MASNFARPENALKRCEELLSVGQKYEALQALRDVITSRKHRTWQKALEKIMFKYIELCVELQKGRFAKDGLIQYRIVCQQVNVNSLEEVIKHFMRLATERAELARSEAKAIEDALDVDDLEADRRPEDLMLSSVSGEKRKDSTDREHVTPCFKFLWETYRTVLEILRNNSKLETLYAMTAHRAFQFCKQYTRTTEFRRLCEIIRNHLSNLNKYRDQRDRPDLTAPESLQLYVDTRFEQLKVATQLELWQESFRSVEDIYGLMCMVKKTPKPSLMVIYYAKLTAIFRVSGNHMYHAYAWLKLFSLQKSFNKNLSQKDLQLIASSVVLAALSVPPFDHLQGASHLELENEKDRNLRMANLIGFNLEPKLDGREVLSRSSLLLELASKGVLACATQEVKDLYYILEHESVPLDLASKVEPLVAKISKVGGKLSCASSVPELQLSQYVPSMEKLATLRLLQQVSHVYQTIKISSLSRMIPFFDFSIVEKISVHAVKHQFIKMKVDHMNGVVLFGTLGLESDELSDHLTKLAEHLNRARVMIYPPTKKAAKLDDLLLTLADKVEKEHKRALAKKSIIEKRKEDHERRLLEKEREEESRRLKLQRITEEAEKKRLASEYEQRQHQKLQREIEERELEEAQALLQEAEKRIKRKGKKPLLDGEKVTKQLLKELALSEQVRERQELEKKLQRLTKNMDHFCRAKSEEASPLSDAAFRERLVRDEKLHEEEKQEEVELSRLKHDEELREKNRLARTVPERDIYTESSLQQRAEEYNRRQQEKEEQIAQSIRNRKQEREEARKIFFYLRSEEIRLNKLQEEEEARKREELERQRQERAEREEKLKRMLEIQRKKEQEVEEKAERLKREALGRPTELAPRVAAELPPGGRPLESRAPAAAAAAPAPAAALAPGKYVPRFKRESSGQAPAAEPDRWGRQETDRRGNDRAAPTGDRLRDDPRSSFARSSGSRPTWSGSRYSSRG